MIPSRERRRASKPKSTKRAGVIEFWHREGIDDPGSVKMKKPRPGIAFQAGQLANNAMLIASGWDGTTGLAGYNL
jgi:hypothetical protein